MCIRDRRRTDAGEGWRWLTGRRGAKSRMTKARGRADPGSSPSPNSPEPMPLPLLRATSERARSRWVARAAATCTHTPDAETVGRRRDNSEWMSERQSRGAGLETVQRDQRCISGCLLWMPQQIDAGLGPYRVLVPLAPRRDIPQRPHEPIPHRLMLEAVRRRPALSATISLAS